MIYKIWLFDEWKLFIFIVRISYRIILRVFAAVDAFWQLFDLIRHKIYSQLRMPNKMMEKCKKKNKGDLLFKTTFIEMELSATIQLSQMWLEIISLPDTPHFFCFSFSGLYNFFFSFIFTFEWIYRLCIVIYKFNWICKIYGVAFRTQMTLPAVHTYRERGTIE